MIDAVPWIFARDVVEGATIEEGDVLQSGPPRVLTLEEEIEALRRELGGDVQKNEIVLERIATLERKVEAQTIADGHRAREADKERAAEKVREDRRVRREALGLTPEGVKQRLRELNAEVSQITTAMNEVQAEGDALVRQATAERPDLPQDFVWQTPQARTIGAKRAALERRLGQIHNERMPLAALLEEEESHAHE